MVMVPASHEDFLKKFIKERQIMKEHEKDEVLLIENNLRFVMFPIKYHEIWAAYKKLEASFWTSEEIELSKDVEDLGSKFNAEQKETLGRLLAMLTVSEQIIKNQLIMKFSAELQNPEGKSFYGFEIMMNTIYEEIYSTMIDTFFDGPKNIPIFKKVSKMPEMKAIDEFLDRWIRNPDSLYAERLVALAAKEGIFYSGARAAIFSITQNGVMPGLHTANKNIFRDMGVYTDFSCLLFAHLKYKPDPKIIDKIITEAVEVEKGMLDKVLEVEKFGVDAAQIKQYVEFLADSLLGSFGNDKHYNVSNPFEFMEGTTSIGKSTFFEKQVSDFTKANETSQKASVQEAFSFNESF